MPSSTTIVTYRQWLQEREERFPNTFDQNYRTILSSLPKDQDWIPPSRWCPETESYPEDLLTVGYFPTTPNSEERATWATYARELGRLSGDLKEMVEYLGDHSWFTECRSPFLIDHLLAHGYLPPCDGDYLLKLVCDIRALPCPACLSWEWCDNMKVFGPEVDVPVATGNCEVCGHDWAVHIPTFMHNETSAVIRFWERLGSYHDDVPALLSELPKEAQTGSFKLEYYHP